MAAAQREQREQQETKATQQREREMEIQREKASNATITDTADRLAFPMPY